MTPLVDDLLEEVLLRLPPHEPASLVRAALVCRRWRRLVSDASFRRRFRMFHRSPKMLGMLCNCKDVHVVRFVRTATFYSPARGRPQAPGHQQLWGRALDARHGRVLLHRKGSDLVVWDPIIDEEWKLPFPPLNLGFSGWTAAVLCGCAAGGNEAGACDHLDCHRRPFVVVLVASGFLGADKWNTFICTYASKTAAWSEPICNNDIPGYIFFSRGSVLVGNALYFTDFWRRVLKYNLELQEISWIPLPSSLPRLHKNSSVLIATENGELGLATKQGSKFCIWLRKQDACTTVVGDEWQKPSRGIKLKTLLPADAAVSKLDVVGSAEGVGIIFMRAGDVVYMIDLKTCKVKKVYQGKIDKIIPYMNFYTPAMESTCGEGPCVGGSSAESLWC